MTVRVFCGLINNVITKVEEKELATKNTKQKKRVIYSAKLKKKTFVTVRVFCGLINNVITEVEEKELATKSTKNTQKKKKTIILPFVTFRDLSCLSWPKVIYEENHSHEKHEKHKTEEKSDLFSKAEKENFRDLSCILWLNK